MSESAKYTYHVMRECFRGVVCEDKMASVSVRDKPRYSAAVQQYLSTVNKARKAVSNSRLVFRG